MRIAGLILAIAATAPAGAAAQDVAPRAAVIASYGECIARNSSGRSRALLTTAIDSPEERRLARSLARGNYPCLDGRDGASMQTGEVRGTVAEALLERNRDTLQRLRSRPAAAPVRATATGGRAFVWEYARCLADADPARAVSFLATAHQSEEERQAFLAFGRFHGECMADGLEYRADIFDVRNHIAARLYEAAYPASAEGTE